MHCNVFALRYLVLVCLEYASSLLGIFIDGSRKNRKRFGVYLIILLASGSILEGRVFGLWQQPQTTSVRDEYRLPNLKEGSGEADVGREEGLGQNSWRVRRDPDSSTSNRLPCRIIADLRILEQG